MIDSNPQIDADIRQCSSGMAQDMTFEAWMKKDKFKTHVIQPFKEYLKVAFRKYRYLRI